MKSKTVAIVLAVCLCTAAIFALYSFNEKQKEIAGLETDKATLQETLTATEGDLTAANDKITVLETDKAALQETLTATEDNLTAANAKVAGLETDMASLREYATELEAKLEAANARHADREALVTDKADKTIKRVGDRFTEALKNEPCNMVSIYNFS